MEFDHIAVSATDLGDGVRVVEAALGVTLAPGGQHDHMATHNRLLSLGPGQYLEVIAPDPAQPAPAWKRWFNLGALSGPPRLTNWIMRTDDLDAALALAPTGAGKATDLQRGDYRWRMAIPETGILPFEDAFPALIQWQSCHPADSLPDVGCRLHRLTVMHPQAEKLRKALQFDDPRIVIAEGDTKGMMAEIQTPMGLRLLT